MSIREKIERMERLYAPPPDRPVPEYRHDPDDLWTRTAMALTHGEPVPPDATADMVAEISRYVPAFQTAFYSVLLDNPENTAPLPNRPPDPPDVAQAKWQRRVADVVRHFRNTIDRLVAEPCVATAVTVGGYLCKLRFMGEPFPWADAHLEGLANACRAFLLSDRNPEQWPAVESAIAALKGTS